MDPILAGVSSQGWLAAMDAHMAAFRGINGGSTLNNADEPNGRFNRSRDKDRHMQRKPSHHSGRRLTARALAATG
ncbi:MAG: hypothetical protein AMS18_08790 [Gemmatimonas sp. SG8_17]|nr:MAG: hypothetical protein AMS18_08790 [Gemmatimonas sp. SG8_17]